MPIIGNLVVTPLKPPGHAGASELNSYIEFTPIPILTVTFNSNLTVGNITTISNVDINTAVLVDTGITVETHTTNVNVAPNTFTLTGQFNDVFVRTLDYIDINQAYKEVNSFGHLPDTYDALYKYLAPTVTSVIKNVDIVFTNGDTYQYEITVVTDWQAANAALVASVRKGKF